MIRGLVGGTSLSSMLRGGVEQPDADADGNVFYPNVDINTEMVDSMIVRRVHEANVLTSPAEAVREGHVCGSPIC